jgi:hypothetical protein
MSGWFLSPGQRTGKNQRRVTVFRATAQVRNTIFDGFALRCGWLFSCLHLEATLIYDVDDDCLVLLGQVVVER